MLGQHTDSQEQIAACTLIWNLCFDQTVRKTCADHKLLNQTLTNIAQASSNDELRRSASGCLCTLMGGPAATSTSKAPSVTPTGNKTVMISYNHDVKQTIKEIKDHLVADGFNVWSKRMSTTMTSRRLTDRSHLSLSSSRCGEHAWQSTRCHVGRHREFDLLSHVFHGKVQGLTELSARYGVRSDSLPSPLIDDVLLFTLECEYAYQRKKCIIPLLFQANYKPE